MAWSIGRHGATIYTSFKHGLNSAVKAKACGGHQRGLATLGSSKGTRGPSRHGCDVKTLCRHIVSSTSSLVTPDHVVRSPLADIDIPNVSLTEYIFSRIALHQQDTKAMIDGPTGRTYTYGQLKDYIIKVASALTKLGYKRGDTVCLFSPNIPEFSILFLAVAAIGGIVTTANPLYNANELARQLDHSQAVAVATIGMFVDLAKEACTTQPQVKEIIVFGEAEGCRPFGTLMMDDGTLFPENVDIDPVTDIVTLPYSSGTTGLPKGVMLTHQNIVSNVIQIREGIALTPDDCMIGVLPFFHIYGMVVVQLGSIRDGSTVVTMPKFDPVQFMQIHQDHKVSVCALVPPIALFLAKHPLVSNYDLSRLRLIISGAAPMGEAVTHEVADRLHIQNIVQGYGLTEASPVTHCDMLPPTFGTIGVCVPNTEAKVVDVGSGELLGPGEEGELCVRGPQVMLGYLNNPEATKDTIINGWLHTGDICHYDVNGYFTVADRLKELIKYKGFQVPPAELEALLVSHPLIEDAAVVGLPDDHAGELPRAYIVKAPGSNMTNADVIGYVDAHVSPHKRLRGGVEFIAEIPKSASGKILRRLLRDKIEDAVSSSSSSSN